VTGFVAGTTAVLTAHHPPLPVFVGATTGDPALPIVAFAAAAPVGS
jgi:hypothetical protein